MLSILLLAACTYCSIDGPLDYTDDDLWICKGDRDDACTADQQVVTFARDGSTSSAVEPREAANDLACFVVYPTIDTRLGPGLHHDVESVPGPKEWASSLARPLQSQCEVYVPIYRQVVVGTYRGAETKKELLCLDNAYADVRDAFDHFLEVEPDRPFVVFGHSQGAQHLARLIRDEIDGNEALKERLLAAYLIGWPIGTEDGISGGSFDELPVCTDPDTPGCVIGYGSYLADDSPPERTRFDEGSERTCVNPADPGGSGRVALAPTLVLGGSPLIKLPEGVADGDTLVAVEGLVEAQCQEAASGVTGLALTWLRDDVTYNQKALVGGDLRAHGIDVHVALQDIRADIERRYQALR